ncbi:universal stress protein [Halanaeroarchaeum sulfurireducens]|uniref:UspA domain-containing protein n=1 Tax=Halanaeroarchaeum sulfurireducens TaxID=1604004 RepID=A0A0F7P6V0_9EURY|nr:universal stress protein [Halanaeroarchaeum sulfurireducens]AKH96901.1 UspA domain-containing protein [Halanaeroarchaeum sulfurireducens]ALG81303.1 UspA domain-containing protein [Halanaeroarchaeum sulfurireducens]
MYERILIPTDGSETAEAAIDHAVTLANNCGSEIHALYVANTQSITLTLGAEQVDRIRQGRFDEMPELREEAEAATGAVREKAEAKGIDVTEHHSGGVPHKMITKYAEDNDMDLIVIGSHGRSGVGKAILGSVAARTLRGTHIPTLVIDKRGA